VSAVQLRAWLGATAAATLLLAVLAVAVPASAAIPSDLAEYKGSWLTFHGENYAAPAEPGGPRAGEGVGSRIDSCDVTGDGIVDLVAAAPNATVGGVEGVGRVYVVAGSADRSEGDYSLPAPATAPLSAEAIQILGRTDRAGAGADLACAGDVNGDGDEDLLVGEYGFAGSNFGYAAYVVFGGELPDVSTVGEDGFEIGDPSFSALVGDEVEAVGDVTGDGMDDLAFSDDLGNRTIVVAGKADGAPVDLATPGSTVMAIAKPSGNTLARTAGVGDVDGDAVPDLLVGLPQYDGPNGEDSGAAFVVSGTARGDIDLTAWEDPGSGVLFPVWGEVGTMINAARVGAGGTVAAAGDLNDDGLADLALAAGGGTPLDLFKPTYGSVWIVFGKGDDAAVDLDDAGEGGYAIKSPPRGETQSNFGAALAPLGDVNGDGIEDLAIGASSVASAVGLQAGAAYLAYGREEPGEPIEMDALSCEVGASLAGDRKRLGLGVSLAGLAGFAGATPALALGANLANASTTGNYVRVIPLADRECDEGGPGPEPGGPQLEIDWGFRENFRRYIANGFDPANPMAPISAGNGALCDANPDTVRGGCDPKLKPTPFDPLPRRALRFTPIGAGATDGSDTTVAGLGEIVFRYPAHFFTLRVEDPWFAIEDDEVTVRARVDLDVDPGFGGAQPVDVRVDLATFPLLGPATVDANRVKWETAPGVLSPEASVALGGFLGSGAEMDPVTIAIPRSLGALPEEPGVPAQPIPATDPEANRGLGGGGAPATSAGTPPAAPAAVATKPRGRAVNAAGLARIGRLSCPARTCTVSTPKRVRVKLDGKRFWAKVLAPSSLSRGQRAALRVRLSKQARALLVDRSAPVRVKVVLGYGNAKLVRVVTARIRASALPAKPGAGAAKGTGTGPSGAPVSAPIASAEPPLLARPLSAVDVSDVRISWFPRDSWVRYVSSGVAAKDGIATSGGATGIASTASACPDRPSSSDAQLPYEIQFAPRASWYDPVSGSAGIYGGGSVSFRWAAHTIDLNAADPEIEIAGAASRAIFRFSGSGGTPYPNQRAALVGLDTAGRPSVGNGGRTLTYNLMRGRLTADGVNVFAGFYGPPGNDEFGCVSVSFTTP